MAISTEQVADGVHRVADGLVNWYLIEEDGRLALVDTGWPRSWPRIEQAVARVTAQQLATEAHAGGIPALARLNQSGPR